MNTSDPTFVQAYTQWQRSREPWKILVRAIREERPREEIDRLAPPAGVDREQLLELLQQHVSARGYLEDLQALPEARKHAKEAKAKREALAKRLDENLTPNQEMEVRDYLRVAESVEAAIQQKADLLAVGVQFVDLAKQVGVL
jgi:hypothetical protein